MWPLGVLVVEDSATARALALEALEATDDVRVLATARTGRAGLALAEQLRPDCVLLDLGLPGMDGLAALRELMATRPVPVVVWTADDSDEVRRAALAAGAVDVVRKGPDDRRLLPRRLREAARRGPPRVVPPRPAACGTEGEGAGPAPGPQGDGARARAPGAVRLVVLGASTGGPPAVARVLASQAPGGSAAFLVVQHMAHGFVEGFVEWLDSVVDLPVRMAVDGARLLPGTVVVAPSRTNTLVGRGMRTCAEPVGDGQWHVPGVDQAFASAAQVDPTATVGVLLSGMGRDGAEGLARLRRAGGWTLAQDEASSVVYGMPRAAAEAGAVCEQGGPAWLADRVASLVAGHEGPRASGRTAAPTGPRPLRSPT